MATKPDALSGQQMKGIEALLHEPSITAAAKAAGVGERTLFRWLEDPAFDAFYRAARRKAVNQAIARLQQVSAGAVAVLAQVAADRKAPPSARVSAAAKLLDLALRACEYEDIEERVKALEERNVIDQEP